MTNNTDIYSAMQTDAPYKTYKKVILGKVFLRVLDPFSDEPMGMHMVGNPNKNEEGCFFHVWSERQDVFLQRMNKAHFKDGTLIEWTKKKKELKVKVKASEKKSYSEYTDEDIEEIAKAKFFKLESILKEADSESFVYRILSSAEELERPEKTLNKIRERLSAIQVGEVPDVTN